MIVDRTDQRDGQAVRLLLTPAEWRRVLDRRGFLDQPDNSYRPRRFRGVAVEIIPSDRVEITRQYA